MEVALQIVFKSCLTFSSILKKTVIDNKEIVTNKAMLLLNTDKKELILYIP